MCIGLDGEYAEARLPQNYSRVLVINRVPAGYN